MRFEELDKLYPNGFVDAELISIRIDYPDRVAAFRVRLRTEGPDSLERDVYRAATLTLRNMLYVTVEPPDAQHLFYANGKSLTFDAFPEDPAAFPAASAVAEKIGRDGFACRFFVHDWNSFIHLAAANAEFTVGDS